MPTTSGLPTNWSVAGVVGPEKGRSVLSFSNVTDGVTYNLAKFPQTLTPSPLVGGYTTQTSVNVLARFNGAGAYISGKSALHKPCNAYFGTLGKETELTSLVEWKIVFLFWEPVSRSGPAPKTGDMIGAAPGLVISANHGTRFAEIAIGEASLISDIKLAATIIHELAHVAGAPGSTDEARAKALADRGSAEYKTLIAAEMALRHCLLPRQFNPEALGLLNSHTQGWRSAGRAIS